MAKKQYKPKDWSSYNQSKVKAGNIFLNLSEDINDWWYDKATGVSNTGRPKRYSNRAIEFILTIRCLFKTKFRQTQGFIEGLFSQMGIELSVPNYSTLSRRAKALHIVYRRQDFKDDIHISVDSTGLKVHSGNQWNAYKHRKKDKQRWLKFHLAVDAKSGEIMASTLTDACTSDSSQVSPLLNQIPDMLEGFYGDGAYDRHQVYDAIKSHQDWPVDIIIPPVKTLKIPDDPSIELNQRQRHRLYLENHGLDKWRSKHKYGRRDKVEGTFAKFKATFGESLLSWDNCAQITEIRLKCRYLNKMNDLYTKGFH